MQGQPFSPSQLRAFGIGLIAFLMLGFSAAILYPFIPAILWATTLSVLTFNWFKSGLNKFSKSKSAPSLAAIRSTLYTFFVIALPFALIGTLAISQITPALNDLTGVPAAEIAARVDKAVGPIFDKVGMKDFHVQEWWTQNGPEVSKNLRAPATKLATQIGVTLFTMVIAMLSMFFFQRDGHLLRQPFLNVIGLPEERGQAILDKCESTIKAVFNGSVIVAVIQGTIMGITYFALGVPNSVLLGFFSILLCIVPLLGAPVVYIPVGLLFLAQGDFVKAGVTFGVGFLIVSQIDNVLKPIFIGDQIGLHPLAIFFFVLGGIAVFGPIGLVVGPTILTVLLALYDYFCELRGLSTVES